ncbi:Threonine/homoserine efflux transporter RhtA [Goodfellowiella coeruleoviolacea]|uniref:Threonine/homoserine efflux transporter RhtA n=2 Tax=Goodfellowiella coeruleoviolacea TaxID=334858 RepID=A0AAE3KJF7_9PSEU|nr:Threonine/homoserine efflux transporter RhtA [Goodfellowiella coeruleoviolacea]
MVLSSVCFGSSGLFASAVMATGWSAPQVTAVRIWLAALVLVLVVGVFRRAGLRVARSEWPLLAGYALLGVVGIQLCYFLAVSRLPVGIALLLEYLSPVLVALWVRFVRGTRLPAAAWLGTALALTGLALVAQVWQGLRLDLLGLLAGLAAAVCSAGYFLLGEHAVSTRDPLGPVTLGMAGGAVLMLLVCPPWLVPGHTLGAATTFGGWHPPVWSLLVALALLGTVAAYLIGMSALRHLPPSVASVLALIEPVLAAAAAWALLGQSLTAAQLVGGVVLLAGALIVRLAGGRPRVEPGPLAEPVPTTGSA